MRLPAYQRRIYRSRYLVSCPLCDSPSRTPTGHARHVHEHHRLARKTHCPWCYEPFMVKGVGKNVEHLMHCFGQLLEYDQSVREATFPITCCDTTEWSPSEYVDHRVSVHGLDKNSDCPWCGGERMPLSHRIACLKTFQKRTEEKTCDEPCRECSEFDSLKERHQFEAGRSKIGEGPFYEPVGLDTRPATRHPYYCRFTDESGLGNDAAGYITQFIEGGGGDEAWFHLMVAQNAYDSFHEALKDTVHVQLLPFSCLCDGSRKEIVEPEYRNHRHCIAVARSKKEFFKMWKKVKFAHRLYENQKCKRKIAIETPHHLCNVMNYVSGRRSGCNGHDLKTDFTRTTKKKHHYHIDRPFGPHASLFLHLCYEGGLQDHLRQKHGNRHLFDRKTLGWYKGKAYVLLKDLPGGPRRCPVPLADGWKILKEEDVVVVVSDGASSFVGLWTLEGHTVSVIQDVNNNNKKGERMYFMDEVQDLKYFLTKSQTTMVRAIQKVKNANETRMQSMKNEKEAKDREMAKLISRHSKLLKECDHYRNETVRLEKVSRLLKGRLEKEKNRRIQKIQKLEMENDHLREKMDREVRHVRELMKVKDEMRKEIQKLQSRKDAEIKQLLVDRLADVVRQHLEQNRLRDETKQLLIDHHAKILREMKAKMDLKDQIYTIWEWVVSAWLGSPTTTRKRARCEE